MRMGARRVWRINMIRVSRFRADGGKKERKREVRVLMRD